MKKLYTAFFLVFFIPFLAAAQGDYRPGYLVLLKGDTLRGLINCKAWNKNPTEFVFKDSLNSSQVKSFSAAITRAIVIPGYKVYKRFVVDISQDEVSAARLSAGLNTKQIRDTVFLDLIDSGKNVTLYQYTDKIKERFFINEKNAKPVELTLHVYPDPDHFSETLRQEIYKRQLQALAVKYLPQFQPVVDEAQEAAYKKEDIEKIVFELNGADNTTTFTSTKPYKARSFAGLGLNAISVNNFAASTYLQPTGTNYTNSTIQSSPSFEINFGEDLFFSQKEESMILRLEFHYSRSGVYSIFDGSGNLLEQYQMISDVSINPQLLFNISHSGSTKIYLGAGGQFFVYSGAKASYIQPNFNETSPPAYYGLNFTLTLRADIILNNKIDIYAGYNPPSPLGQQQNTLSAFRAGISYLFGAK